MPNILVIDDDVELYSLLAEYFAQTGFESRHAVDAESGLKQILADPSQWDAVVLDIMLPGIDGLEVLRRLRERASTRDLPVLMLTARGEEGERVTGLEAGADDYLGKPFSMRELTARLRALLRRSRQGEAVPLADILRIDNLVVDRAALQIVGEGKPINLSPLELRLLEVLAETPGRIVNREELYRRVFDHAAFDYDRSLDMAISRLRKKLGPRSDGGERIRAAWGEGYIFLLPGASA